MKHNWEYKRLCDICAISSARRVHQADWKDSGVPFYRAREIVKLSENGTVDNELFISQELFDELSKLGVPKAGDIMLSAVGTLGATYIVKSTDHFYYKDASVICLGDIRSLLPTFLCYLFDSKIIKHQISRQAKGATVGTITISNASKFQVPVPPMEVQQQIVAALDKINEVIDDCRELLRNLDALAQSLFYDYFGDPVINPKGWNVKLFADVFKLSSGDGLSAKNIVHGEYPVYGGNGIVGYHNVPNLKGANIIIGRVGALCGNVRLVNGDIFVTDNAFITSFKENLNILFTERLLKTLNIRQYANAAAQPVISNSSLKGIPIILPPLELQEKFAERIEQIDTQKKTVKETISNLQTLLDSRMDYWFN